jgi:hypothetical protein
LTGGRQQDVRIPDGNLFAVDTHIHYANHIFQSMRRESGREFSYDAHVLAISYK